MGRPWQITLAGVEGWQHVARVRVGSWACKGVPSPLPADV